MRISIRIRIHIHSGVDAACAHTVQHSQVLLINTERDALRIITSHKKYHIEARRRKSLPTQTVYDVTCLLALLCLARSSWYVWILWTASLCARCGACTPVTMAMDHAINNSRRWRWEKLFSGILVLYYSYWGNSSKIVSVRCYFDMYNWDHTTNKTRTIRLSVWIVVICLFLKEVLILLAIYLVHC